MKKHYRAGLAAALGCATLWGLLPLYWKALATIDSGVIIFYRIVMVALVCALFSLKKQGLKKLAAPLKDRRALLVMVGAGALITFNWSLYIWAVNAGFVIETSVGYYMEPLVVCLFGVIIFKERFTSYRKVAFGLAFAGVLISVISLQKLPFIALGLALSFASYAALKKNVKYDALTGLFYETVLLALPALLVIVYLELSGRGALAVATTGQYTLLLMCGLVTAIPLGLFAYAAQNLPLITLGITEYISPTLGLLLGIFVFDEPFSYIQLVTFLLIWLGLIIFTVGEAKLLKADQNRV